ncbi:MAG: hypothetical protein Q8R02_25085 [Hyphomonadaceae bacterium]|nr:hypothetical protein [Hyphomonadaceae bacterium]
MGLALLLATVLGAQEGPAAAPPADDAPSWTFSLTGDYSTIPDADPDLKSKSAGAALTWTSDTTSIGGAISGLQASTLPAEFATASDGDGWMGSAFVAWAAGEFDLDLSVSHAQQTLEGTGRIRADGPPALAGRDVNVDGETRSSSVSFGVAKTFGFDTGGFDTGWVTPHARIAWNQAESEVSTALVGGGSGLQLNSDASGGSLAAGVEAGTDLAPWLSVFVDVTGVASSNEAANVFGFGGRAVARPVSAEEDEGAAWAELSAGFTIHAPADVSIGFAAGASAGREEDDVFGSLTLSKGF